MASNQKLNKIENSLTPRQTILLWLNEAHAHPNFESYAKWIAESPDARSPFRFVENATETFENRSDLKKPQDKYKIIQQAKQEYEFLYNLFLNVNFELMKLAREKSLWAQLLIDRLVSLKSGDREIDAEDVSYWKDLFFGFHAETHMQRRAFTALAEKYFPGHQIIFRDSIEVQEKYQRLSTFLHETFNDFCHGRDIVPIDLLEFEQRLRPHIDCKVRSTADLAKAEVLVKWDRREEGVNLVKKYAFSSAV